MTRFLSCIAGALFAVGLMISGMTRPPKVKAFLDFFGEWDPTLAFVMVGAIAVYSLLYRLPGRSTSLNGERLEPPAHGKGIDASLIGGAVLFGLGWGVSGYCPGPALASIGAGTVDVAIFVGAMLAGMWLFNVVARVRPGTDA